MLKITALFETHYLNLMIWKSANKEQIVSPCGVDIMSWVFSDHSCVIKEWFVVDLVCLRYG